MLQTLLDNAPQRPQELPVASYMHDLTVPYQQRAFSKMIPDWILPDCRLTPGALKSYRLCLLWALDSSSHVGLRGRSKLKFGLHVCMGC